MRGGGPQPAPGDKGFGDQGGPIEGVNLPKLDPQQRSNREELAPLTKKQYSGTWTLDKGAIERVCAAEWLRRLSEGFGQGAQIELKIYLHAFSDSVNCQTAGNSIIQNSRLAIIGFHSSRPQRVGINKTSTCFEIWAWLGSWMMSPFYYIKLYYSTNTNANATCYVGQWARNALLN